MLRRLLVGLLLVVSLLILAAGASGFFRRTRTATTIFSGVERIVVLVDAGNVAVTSHSSANVEVRRQDSSMLSSARRAEQLRNGRLRLEARCRAPYVLCDVDYQLRVPSDVDIRIKLRSGGLQVKGISGAVLLHSNAGNIEADDLSGRVQLRTNAGTIDGDGLSSATTSARADAGSIQLAFVVPPRLVDVRAGAGNVALLVPDERYRVVTDVGAGNLSVTVQTSASEQRIIRARTTAGNIQIRPTT